MDMASPRSAIMPAPRSGKPARIGCAARRVRGERAPCRDRFSSLKIWLRLKDSGMALALSRPARFLPRLAGLVIYHHVSQQHLKRGLDIAFVFDGK